jgi:RNA polymerase sigma-70 factor (ECF subfamily)
MPLSLDEETFDVPTRPTQSDGLEVMALDRALATLPEEQRAVLLLVAVEEMSYADIAAALGIPVGTVMSRLSRGRERLRQAMEGRAAGAPLRVVR